MGDKMKIVLKRVVAYMIDIILVSLVSTFLTSNSYINKDYNKYTSTYEKYEESYEEYSEFLSDFEEVYDDKKITEEEYDELKEESKTYISYLKDIELDKELAQKEYENIVENINEEYFKIEENYSYKLVKLSIIPTIISLLCILMYFVVLQYYCNGQTLGKKLMKLQVKSNNDRRLNILNYLIRCLIVNEVFVNIISVVFLLILNKQGYILYSQIIYVITYILEVAIIFSITFNKEHRGLHDIVSNTKVIELNK